MYLDEKIQLAFKIIDSRAKSGELSLIETKTLVDTILTCEHEIRSLRIDLEMEKKKTVMMGRV